MDRFGRENENIRLSLPTKRPIFSWTEHGKTPQSPMNPTVKRRIDLQVALRQLKKRKGSTVSFLTREDNSRDLLGNFHKDKSVWIRAKRRVLQCIASGYQFPCALQLKCGAFLKKSNADFVKSTMKRKTWMPRTQSKVLDTSNAIAQHFNYHE